MKGKTHYSSPEVTLRKRRGEDGSSYLTFHGDRDLLDAPELSVRVSEDPEGGWNPEASRGRISAEAKNNKEDIIYPVFRQNAMAYGPYSEYMRHHGCACCSLTSLLAACCPRYRELKPQDTIELVERKHFSDQVWEKNYGGQLSAQMPVTLYGISEILSAEGIDNEYTGAFRNHGAMEDIRNHLCRGLPVVIETSRLRRGRRTGLPVSINDRRYAGSYHTMILLGLDRKGYVIFTDSATRDWAGRQQRLKRDRLDRLIRYMFPRIIVSARNVYFDHRWNTGGYIKVFVDKKRFVH